MRAALESVDVDGATVSARFRPVDDIALTRRGPEHVAACVLDRFPRT
jgi:hypothetical protein